MRLFDKIDKWKYATLLGSLIAFIIIPPFINHTIAVGIIGAAALTLVFLTSADAMLTSKRFIFLWFLIIFVLISLRWISLFLEDDFFIETLFVVLLFGFFIYVIWVLIRKMIIDKEVSINSILIAISIYLIMGILFGFFASLINVLYADAYAFSESTPESFYSFVYFSFVTMTTLGYGDIIPSISETQALSVVMSLTGQLYIAITIALLVGKYAAGRKND